LARGSHAKKEAGRSMREGGGRAPGGFTTNVGTVKGTAREKGTSGKRRSPRGREDFKDFSLKLKSLCSGNLGTGKKPGPEE